MDLQQAKILIEKINSLFKGMDGSDHALSTIERDLMLSYIRQLYESFLNVRTPQDINQPVVRSSTSEVQEMQMEVVAPKQPEAVPPKAKPKKVVKAPKIIEIPDSLKDLEKATPPPKPKPKSKPEAPKPTKEPLIPKATPKVKAPVKTGEYGVLFENKVARELSEKLGERKVQDLTRAMAINDRLLYMNELFGRDADALGETLKVLNRYETMNEAKGLIMNLAEQYNWLEEEKVPIAQDFVKLVRRRYI